MEIEKYGIRLKRLTEADLEQVRTWRNADFVRSQMEYQKWISPEDQLAWFQSLHTQNDLYFVAWFEEAPFALVNVKEINWEALSGEAGIFVADPVSLGHPVSALIVLALMDYCFEELGLKQLYAKIRKENHQAIQFNRKLGYTLMEGESGKTFGRWRVNPTDYYAATDRLRKAAHKWAGRQGKKDTPGST